MPTNTEKRIASRRKVKQEGILVPLINDLLKDQVGVDFPSDVEFLAALSMKQVHREQQRKEAWENGETVISPSGLASCLRRSYLSKNHMHHELDRVKLEAIEPHYYFLTGDFIHLKWQYVFYRLNLKHPRDIALLDCEMPVMSKHKDHGGTIDTLMFIGAEPFIVDIKGLNVRNFNAVARGEPPHSYRVQVTDYMMLFNSMLTRGIWKPDEQTMKYLEHHGLSEFPQVKRGILLAENKGGPDTAHPAALAEHIIELKPNLPEVRARMEALRGYDAKKEIPPAECESTRLLEFTGCPFAGFCYPEVREREARRLAASESKEFRLAKRSRRHRTRRP